MAVMEVCAHVYVSKLVLIFIQVNLSVQIQLANQVYINVNTVAISLIQFSQCMVNVSRSNYPALEINVAAGFCTSTSSITGVNGD